MEHTTLRREVSQSHVRCRPALVLVLATYWRTHRTARALLSLMTKPENTNSERIPEVIPSVAIHNLISHCRSVGTRRPAQDRQVVDRQFNPRRYDAAQAIQAPVRGCATRST